jgi:hypothetical protein
MGLQVVCRMSYVDVKRLVKPPLEYPVVEYPVVEYPVVEYQVLKSPLHPCGSTCSTLPSEDSSDYLGRHSL